MDHKDVTFAQIPALVAEKAVSVQYEKKAALDWNALLSQGKQVLQTPEAIGALGGAGLGGLIGGVSAATSPKKRKSVLSSIGTGALAGGLTGLGGGAIYRNMQENLPALQEQAPGAADAAGDITGKSTEDLVKEYYDTANPPPFKAIENAADTVGRGANTGAGIIGDSMRGMANPLMPTAMTLDALASGARAYGRNFTDAGKNLIPISGTAFDAGIKDLSNIPNVGNVKGLGTELGKLSDHDKMQILLRAATGEDAPVRSGKKPINLTPAQVNDIVRHGGAEPGLMHMIGASRTGDPLSGSGYAGRTARNVPKTTAEMLQYLDAAPKETPGWLGKFQRLVNEVPRTSRMKRLGLRVPLYGGAAWGLNKLFGGSSENQQRLEELAQEMARRAAQQ